MGFPSPPPGQSGRFPVRVGSTPYRIGANDIFGDIFVVETSGGPFTVPAATKMGLGAHFRVKNALAGSADLTLTFEGADFDTAGASSCVISGGSFDSVLFYCDGKRWFAEGNGNVAASAFTDLTDVPNSYSGAGGKVVAVKDTEDALEFIDASSGGGGLVKISTTVVPGATSVTIALPAGYNSFTVKGRSINMNGSGGLCFRAGYGAGPTIDTGNNYGWVGYSQRDGATACHGNAGTGQNFANLGEFGFPQTSGDQQGSFTLEIANPNDGFIRSFYGFMYGSNGAGSGYFMSVFSCNWLNAANPMTAIQFGSFSANEFTGTFDLYGWVS
jgi:hypothetical protein